MKFKIENPNEFYLKALAWANKQECYMLLNGNSIEGLYPGFPLTLAVGNKLEITGKSNGFNALNEILGSSQPVFGYLGYDLKNETEQLISSNFDASDLPLFYFFVPKSLLYFSEKEIEIESINPSDIFLEIQSTIPFEISIQEKHSFTCDTSLKEYTRKVSEIRQHIEEGDVYELNYCIKFSSEGIIDPLSCYLQLNKSSQNPFSFLLQAPEFSIISASPERFLKKTGNKIICQPMKGTAKRSTNPEIDIKNKKALFESEKERAENMMIVDLTRNDLSRSCIPGSVQVEELFKVYSYKQVHQMVSTITGTLKPDVTTIDLIKNAFPMGSMTGAPKIRAMQLIEDFENSFRGVFSGAAGYFTPDGDFDLNVIIRSLYFNKRTKNLSFSVGSAITYDSDAHLEYQECLLKAENIFKLFQD